MDELMQFLNEKLPAQGPVLLRLGGVLSLLLIVIYSGYKSINSVFGKPTIKITPEEIEKGFSPLAKLFLVELRSDPERIILKFDARTKELYTLKIKIEWWFDSILKDNFYIYSLEVDNKQKVSAQLTNQEKEYINKEIGLTIKRHEEYKKDELNKLASKYLPPHLV